MTGWFRDCWVHEPLTPCQCRSCAGAPANPIHATSCRTSVPKLSMGAPLLGARPTHALRISLVPRCTCKPHPCNLLQNFCPHKSTGAPRTGQVLPAEQRLCNAPTPTLVQDFYAKECWAHHPKPYADFLDSRRREHEALEADRKRAIRI